MTALTAWAPGVSLGLALTAFASVAFVWFMHRLRARSADMITAAKMIDAGHPCPCCHVPWMIVEHRWQTADRREIHVEERWEMDHIDWCPYAEWAGL